MSHQELIQELRNIGPAVATKLVNAGIDTPSKLRKIGAKEAFLRILRSGGFCGKLHVAYLYALEGAILDCPWQDIPEEKKIEYKRLMQQLKKESSV
tara:strand:+ start:148 stop:435 length:288 start_codon:yes stop_codon:yes gene_type:complete